MTTSRTYLVGLLFFIASVKLGHADNPGPVSFDRDIRPILSENCYFCHGPDSNKRKAKLRFDIRESALAAKAIIPGNPTDSLLTRRIHHSDPEEIMPPPKSKLQLTSKEKRLLDQWIKQGAPYSQLWSFVKPVNPPLPELPADLRDWPRNELDHFVAAKLVSENIRPSPEAEKHTLLRRVTLDLTGLPPTPQELDHFLSDRSENAYEKVIDRLLSSPHYGERMALPWLDAARYADTGGYQGDLKKTQWPWRDWVIRSYNENLPFDQFTIQQLAGDLLPNPSQDQRLATAFNRNHRINDEGGIIPEEFLVEYVADRVETTSTVWLGLTVGCARCHDHKYDPITQRDFYSLYAFFHNIPENGKDGDLAPKPKMDLYTGGTEEEHKALQNKLAELNKRRNSFEKAHQAEFTGWLERTDRNVRNQSAFAELPQAIIHAHLDEVTGKQSQNLGSLAKPVVTAGIARRVTPNRAAQHGNGFHIGQGGYIILGTEAKGYQPNHPMSWSAWLNPTRDIAGVEGPIFSCVTPDQKRRGYLVNLSEKDNKSFTLVFRLQSDQSAGEVVEVKSRNTIPRQSFSHITVSYDGSMNASGVKMFINGVASPVEIHRDKFGTPAPTSQAHLAGAETDAAAQNATRDELLANTTLDDLRIYSETLTSQQVAAIFQFRPDQLLASKKDLTPPEKGFLTRNYFRNHNKEFQELNTRFIQTQSQLKGFESQKITSVSIMEEMAEPRKTYLLNRGAYDQPDKSTPLLPATFENLPAMPDSLPRNRLGLANWILSDENPLTARVAVNRSWQMFFGNGLVRTPEDFGSQGAPPTHPELLDWLAIEFRERGWDIKALHKLILSSATYRQSSVVSASLLARDPENKLLGRAPRFRLYGQALRDQALAVSGQLDPTIGGPPVMPYQPDKLWEEVSAKGVKYIVGKGSDLYRRSIYTFWRRTVPPPSMMNFDNSSREICSVGTSRTNTPLQAMNLMNDPQYVEAGRVLAQRMIREGGASPREQISFGHKLALARKPGEPVLQILTRGYENHLANYRQNPEDAQLLLGVGKSKPSDDLDPAQLAAATAIASILLNLDETVTKE